MVPNGSQMTNVKNVCAIKETLYAVTYELVNQHVNMDSYLRDSAVQSVMVLLFYFTQSVMIILKLVSYSENAGYLHHSSIWVFEGLSDR